ncbi:protein NRT1/ PTR FAMILY 2.13-like [Iris pallida]|uniref:Protein NRT1/ PTR FAMILY 2.13-like n=1 Tax=Iris pallida TaxID=29817 RepID=A0AAX6ENL9_IRIPA|nr:protein NRT1/ PTR FAMILY 2.13-like [Iris pallida]
MGADDEVDEIEQPHGRYHVVEVVHPPQIDVVVQPRRVPLEYGHHEAAYVVGPRHAAVEQRVRQRLHLLRELPVVELHLPHRVERLPDPHQRQLRRQPQRRQRRHPVRATLGPARLPPLPLHQPRHHHRPRRDDHPHALPLEDRDPALQPRDPPRQRGYDPVVDRDEQGQRQQRDRPDGGRRDLEARAEVAVHAEGLEHGEGPLLGQGDEADDAGGPDGHDPQEALHLLDLLDRAEPPRVRDRAVLLQLPLAYDCSLVQEPECHSICGHVNVRVTKG